MLTTVETRPLLRATNGVIALPNGTKVRTFPPPPPGFDPDQASASELATYGLPARPADAAQRARWEPIVRSLGVEPVFSQIAASTAGSQLPAPGEVSDTHMGGAVTPVTDTPVWVVESVMTVPNVVPPSGGGAASGAAFWVAIVDGENFLVKLGFQCHVTGDGAVRRTFPFWEWQPAGGAFSIPDLTIVPGDALWCAISSDHTSATFYLINLTSNTRTQFEIGSPVGVTLTGNYAAWMVEPLAAPPRLAQFGRTFLDTANAYTFQNAHLGPDSQLIDLVDASGRVLARPLLRTANLLLIYSENL
jgi:hypothetical protein